MAGECTYSSHCAGDDTFCTAKQAGERRHELAGHLNGVSAGKSSSSPFFEMIGDSLYRKKLERGCVQYREVLVEDKRLSSIKAFHAKVPGKPHHTLDDTYRLVAEHYWWEGMYFQVRDFVLSCEECNQRRTEKSQPQCSEVRNVSRMVNSHSHDVLSKLNSQRKAGLFCDITLKTGSGHSFVAHKSVLAAVSEYFQELFTEMDSATDPQPHVDLTGFSEESMLALLEFSYTSTLTLNLSTLVEVAAMARHLRIWPALEACSAIQREQDSSQQCSVLLSGTPTTSMKGLRDEYSISGRGFKRKREMEQAGTLGSSWSSSVKSGANLTEATDESDREACDRTLNTPCQSQAEDGNFPCSPTRRMKLMDFKSPSSKRKQSPRPSPSVITTSPSTSTRSSSPSRRLLRSTPGAALALRRLLPKIDLSSKRKKKKSLSYRIYRAKSDFPTAQSQSQPGLVTHVKVKQEALEEDVCSTVLQDEVQSPRAQEKYQLLSFLGLQRKSLLPCPEERSGWGQKKRLRKLKVSDYSLTARRKPRMQGVGGYEDALGDFAGVSSSLSLCDMTRMDLIKKVIKTEAQDCSVTMDKRSKRNQSTTVEMQHSNVRTTRSQSLTEPKGTRNDRPLRSQSRGPGKPVLKPTAKQRVMQRGHSPQKKATVRKKHEPTDYAISPLTLSGTRHNRGQTVAPPRASKSGPPADRTLRISSTETKRTLRYNIGHTMDKLKGSKQNKPVRGNRKQASKHAKVKLQPEQGGVARGNQVCEVKKKWTQGSKIEEKADPLQGARGWQASSTNHRHYFNNPLYRAIKEEPADPVPLSQAFPSGDAGDLGKRQSKPSVKLLDQSFLFGLCRTPGGIKREEESVDICLTRSVSHGSTSRNSTSPSIVRRDRIRARIMPDRTGLDGPHWAGLGNRSTPFSQRLLFQVKKEEDESSVSRQLRTIGGSTKHKVSKRSCKIKKEPPKTKNVNKLYPVSSRKAVMLESIRRARLKQCKSSSGQVSGGTHTCLQCRTSSRDCDALILHRMRHIEGKHWPCPLCSKTFFRQKNLRNHIRTHNPKLYKCHQCIAAS